jgi:hypothetical protein
MPATTGSTDDHTRGANLGGPAGVGLHHDLVR